MIELAESGERFRRRHALETQGGQRIGGQGADDGGELSGRRFTTGRGHHLPRTRRPTHDLDAVRAALFMEQRGWRDQMTSPYDVPEAKAYIQALVEKIRELSGGTLPGPGDPYP